MVDQLHHEGYIDSDTVPSEEEYECYRAAFNSIDIVCINGDKEVEAVNRKKPSPTSTRLNEIDTTLPGEKEIVMANTAHQVNKDSEECWKVDYSDQMVSSLFFCCAGMVPK
eukprot:sb/3477171/